MGAIHQARTTLIHGIFASRNSWTQKFSESALTRITSIPGRFTAIYEKPSQWFWEEQRSMILIGIRSHLFFERTSSIMNDCPWMFIRGCWSSFLSHFSVHVCPRHWWLGFTSFLERRFCSIFRVVERNRFHMTLRLNFRRGPISRKQRVNIEAASGRNDRNTFIFFILFPIFTRHVHTYPKISMTMTLLPFGVTHANQFLKVQFELPPALSQVDEDDLDVDFQEEGVKVIDGESGQVLFDVSILPGGAIWDGTFFFRDATMQTWIFLEISTKNPSFLFISLAPSVIGPPLFHGTRHFQAQILSLSFLSTFKFRQRFVSCVGTYWMSPKHIEYAPLFMGPILISFRVPSSFPFILPSHPFFVSTFASSLFIHRSLHFLYQIFSNFCRFLSFLKYLPLHLPSSWRKERLFWSL